MQIVEAGLRITAARSWQSCQPCGPANVHAAVSRRAPLHQIKESQARPIFSNAGQAPREGETPNRQ
jgi:hypothetical protein